MNEKEYILKEGEYDIDIHVVNSERSEYYEQVCVIRVLLEHIPAHSWIKQAIKLYTNLNNREIFDLLETAEDEGGSPIIEEAIAKFKKDYELVSFELPKGLDISGCSVIKIEPPKGWIKRENVR